MEGVGLTRQTGHGSRQRAFRVALYANLQPLPYASPDSERRDRPLSLDRRRETDTPTHTHIHTCTYVQYIRWSVHRPIIFSETESPEWTGCTGRGQTGLSRSWGHSPSYPPLPPVRNLHVLYINMYSKPIGRKTWRWSVLLTLVHPSIRPSPQSLTQSVLSHIQPFTPWILALLDTCRTGLLVFSPSSSGLDGAQNAIVDAGWTAKKNQKSADCREQGREGNMNLTTVRQESLRYLQLMRCLRLACGGPLMLSRRG